ncbi:MAG: ArsR/SmtB family transcription factor [Bacillota bacterium]
MNNKKIYELHADVCKSIAHAKRIEIIYLLQNEEMHVDQIARKMGISKANVSQHLSLLREKGVVYSRKEGLKVYYKICSPKLIKACELMKEIMLERLSEKMNISKEILSKEIE